MTSSHGLLSANGAKRARDGEAQKSGNEPHAPRSEVSTSGQRRAKAPGT